MDLGRSTALLDLGRSTPPLKWVGGKRWLVPHVAPLWQAANKRRQRRYLEPFCGGLGLQPVTALLNDVNPHLINFYRQVQSGLRLDIETRNDRELFYAHRIHFNLLIKNGKAETPLGAQLFYYLNRTCYNGLCRFNRSGEFNVPFGQYKKVNYEPDFRALRERFSGWQFTPGDLTEVAFEREDSIYADPLYEFTTYSAGGFDWNDQVRTAEWLAAHRRPVVLSNQATTRIVKLYKGLGFKLKYLNAPRRISCTGDRTKAREVLAVRI